jgi:DNA-binding SARP family transcriptional activator
MMTASFVADLIAAAHNGDNPPVLHLFDDPYLLLDGRRRELPEGSKRLVAFLALSEQRIGRRAAACRLWPTVTESRAAGNLRSALWRLRGAGLDVVETDKDALALRKDMLVDIELIFEWAARMIGDAGTERDLACGAWRTRCVELLPGWYDDWVLLERERLRYRYLHGLEAMSRLLTRNGRCAEAVESAMAVIAVDPLRESAQRLLVEAHLAEGNVGEALRCFQHYRALVQRELRVDPSPELTALLHPLATGNRVHAAPHAVRSGAHRSPSGLLSTRDRRCR